MPGPIGGRSLPQQIRQVLSRDRTLPPAQRQVDQQTELLSGPQRLGPTRRRRQCGRAKHAHGNLVTVHQGLHSTARHQNSRDNSNKSQHIA